MSKIAFKPSDTGTGTLEITAPSTNMTREIELPDADGLLFNQGNIVGTVSESGGVPTGAVIETGENANGEYIKYADGTLICSTIVTLTFTNTATLTTTWTYPHAYVGSVPRVTGSPRQTPPGGQRSALLYMNSLNLTTTTPTIIHDAAPYASGNTLPVCVVAVGRWF